MTLVNRWYQILQLLVAHKEVSIQELKEKMAASPQTVKKSVDQLNEELVGIAKIVNTNNLFQLEIQNYDSFDEVMAGKLKMESDFNSASRRVAYLFKRLINVDDFLLMDDLSEELGVSRGTVVKDLKVLKKIAAEFGVEVVGTPNRGLKIEGEEFDLRLLLVYYVYAYFPEVMLFPETLKLIEHLSKITELGKQNTGLLKKVVDVVLQRLLEAHQINLKIPFYTNYSQANALLDELIYHIETTYHVTLSQYEQDFISFPLNITNVGEVEPRFIKEAELRDYFQLMMTAIHESLIVEIDEEKLFQEMKFHLMHMMNRLVFRIEINDLFFGEIESKYPFAYELAKTGLTALAKILNRQATSVEISYLALYFELILRDHINEDQPKEIAIVCSTGRGTAQIIRRQIERVIGADIKITQYSEEEYEKKNLNHYFAVFTTIPLKNVDEKTPIIHLTSLFNDNWLRTEWEKATQTRRTNYETVTIEFQHLDNQQSYHENLQKMILNLSDKALVDEAFGDRVFEREAKQTTVFSEGIAFPHTINKDTDRIILSIGAFEETKMTTDGPIKVVILLAIPETITGQNESELLELYDSIFTFVGQPEFQEEIRNLTDTESLIELMRRKEIL